MSKAPITITIDPDSELGRALDETDDAPLILLRNGARFLVTPDANDPWSTYDADRVRAGLRKFAGMISSEDADKLKATIYRGREEGTRPINRP